jgi:hypothetical protein
MVVVRSVRMLTSTRTGAWPELRQQLLDAVHHGDDVGAGLALDVEITAGVSFIQAACLTFSASSTTVATSETADRGAVAVGHHQRLVVGADSNWSLAPIWNAWCGPSKLPLAWLTLALPRWRSARPPGSGRRRPGRGVRLDPHRRLLAAADAHQADARQAARSSGRQARVGQVLHLGAAAGSSEVSARVRMGVGRIGLAVDRRIGQVGRQVGAGGVDGLPAPAARPRRCSGPARTAA